MTCNRAEAWSAGAGRPMNSNGPASGKTCSCGGGDPVAGFKSFAEIVHVAEIVQRIFVGPLHLADFDQREDQTAKIERGCNVPPAQDRPREQAPFSQRQLAQAFAQ